MYKQIIIARRDLEMSPGKLAAQVSHASMAFLTTMVRENTHKYCTNVYRAYKPDGSEQWYRHPDLYELAKQTREEGKRVFYAGPVNPANPYGKLHLVPPNYYYELKTEVDAGLFNEWIKGSFTKCVLGARNKNKLMKAVEMAENLGMKEGADYFLIRDNCNTELEPEDEDGRTLTCIGFKPMPEEIIDQIGKKFHLY